MSSRRLRRSVANAVTHDQLEALMISLIGKNNALETLVTLLLETHPDLAALGRRADQALVNREADLVPASEDELFTIKVSELARQHLEAIMINARERRTPR